MLLYLKIVIPILAVASIILALAGETCKKEEHGIFRRITVLGWTFLSLSVLTCACTIIKDQITDRDSATQRALLSSQNTALHDDNAKLQAATAAQEVNIQTLNSSLASASQRLESQNQLSLLTQLSGRKLSTAAFQIEMPEQSNLAQDPIEFLVSRIPTEFREFVQVDVTFSAISGFIARKTYHYKGDNVICDDTQALSDPAPEIAFPGYTSQNSLIGQNPQSANDERHQGHHYLLFSQDLAKVTRSAALTYKDIVSGEMGSVSISFSKEFPSVKLLDQYLLSHPEYKNAESWDEYTPDYNGKGGGEKGWVDIPIPKDLQSQIADYLRQYKHPRSFVYLEGASLLLYSESSLTEVEISDSAVVATFKQNSTPRIQVGVPPTEDIRRYGY